MKELVDYSNHGNRTSDFKKIVEQANYAIELQAENEALKAELSSVEDDINKIKADAIVQAVVDCNVTPQMGSDIMGTILVTDILEYANNLTKP